MPVSSGTAVILIHGLSDTREVWSRQLDGLYPMVNPIAYDVRGFGASPVGKGDGTVDQMADDLAQLISALEGGPAWLVGFSMGGVIAQRFALDFPMLTSGIILIASSCIVGRTGRDFFDKRINEVSTGGLTALAAISKGDAKGCLASNDEELIAEYQRIRSASVDDPKGYLNACYAMRALSDGSLAANIEHISCPTLVISPELDPYCPPRASKMIANAIPGSTMEVVKGAGHCVHVEAADVVNQLIMEFIQKNN